MAAQTYLKLGEVSAESGLMPVLVLALVWSNFFFWIIPVHTCNKGTTKVTVAHCVPPGNYPQALEDFQECLALQLKHLPPHSRLLAETHYHVATTLCYMDQYSQAIQHYNSSIEVIETRLGKSLVCVDQQLMDGASRKLLSSL